MKYAYFESGLAQSCWWVPRSTATPLSRTMIWVARTTVERRWAITTVVFPCIKLSSAAWTTASFPESSADVASSSSRSFGSLSTARAIATRCFWPPEMRTPFSPGRAS